MRDSIKRYFHEIFKIALSKLEITFFRQITPTGFMKGEVVRFRVQCEIIQYSILDIQYSKTSLRGNSNKSGLIVHALTSGQSQELLIVVSHVSM